MPYREPLEQTFELLRQVVATLGRLGLPCHPLNYRTIYEHLAGLNPLLSSALEKRLSANAPLIDAELRRLHAIHIASRDAAEAEKVQREFELLLDSAAHDAQQAKLGVGLFEATLKRRAKCVSTLTSANEIQHTVTELVEDTNTVMRVVVALADTIAHQQKVIEGLRERAQLAHSEAVMDSLTGIRNRRGFERALKAQLGGRKRPERAALLQVDIDRFKRINDTHGHVIGDMVIAAVAHTIRDNIRAQDLLARFGGDEMLIYLPATPLLDARALAETLRARIAALRIIRADGSEGLRGEITVSIGVAAFKTGDTLDTVRARADTALYAAKGAGRNCVCVDEVAPPF